MSACAGVVSFAAPLTEVVGCLTTKAGGPLAPRGWIESSGRDETNDRLPWVFVMPVGRSEARMLQQRHELAQKASDRSGGSSCCQGEELHYFGRSFAQTEEEEGGPCRLPRRRARARGRGGGRAAALCSYIDPAVARDVAVVAAPPADDAGIACLALFRLSRSRKRTLFSVYFRTEKIATHALALTTFSTGCAASFSAIFVHTFYYITHGVRAGRGSGTVHESKRLADNKPKPKPKPEPNRTNIKVYSECNM